MTRSFCDDQIINQAIGCFNVTSNYLTIFIVFCVFCNFCASERAQCQVSAAPFAFKIECEMVNGMLFRVVGCWEKMRNQKSYSLKTWHAEVLVRVFFWGACGFQNAHAWQCFGCREILVYRPSTWEFITKLEAISR